MTMPEVTFRDMMRRTMHNLKLMDRQVNQFSGSGEPPYEFTQLINSFLGALALPRERDLYAMLRKVSIEDAQNDDQFPVLKNLCLESQDESIRAACDIPENLEVLVGFIRNGIAHGNMDLIQDANGDIARIRLTNSRKVKGGRFQMTWGTELDVHTLRQVLDSFFLIANRLYAEATDPKPRSDETVADLLRVQSVRQPALPLDKSAPRQRQHLLKHGFDRDRRRPPR